MKNAAMQRALKVAMGCSWDKVKRALVSNNISVPIKPNTYKYNTVKDNPITFDPFITPAHDIQALIQVLPEVVEASYQPKNKKNKNFLLVNLLDWRDLNEVLKPYIFQLALSEIETESNHSYQLTPFTFMISNDLESAIQAQKRKRVDYLRDRIQKALKQALHRPHGEELKFWFLYETANNGAPHIHGSLLMRPDEKKIVTDVFKKINGKLNADEESCHLIVLSYGKRQSLFAERGRLFTDLNWVDYPLKERATTRLHYNDDDVKFTSIFAATQPLIKDAKDYHNRLMAEFKRHRKANPVDKTRYIKDAGITRAELINKFERRYPSK
jgi:hypothetical protein